MSKKLWDHDQNSLPHNLQIIHVSDPDQWIAPDQWIVPDSVKFTLHIHLTGPDVQVEFDRVWKQVTAVWVRQLCGELNRSSCQIKLSCSTIIHWVNIRWWAVTMPFHRPSRGAWQRVLLHQGHAWLLHSAFVKLSCGWQIFKYRTKKNPTWPLRGYVDSLEPCWCHQFCERAHYW